MSGSTAKLAQLRNRLRTDAANRSMAPMATRPASNVTPERASQMRDTLTPPTAAKGTSGKPLLGGRVSGFEHNTRLQGPQALMLAYRKAERTPGVASGWGCARGLALSARWDVEAADDSADAQAIAEHVRVNLGIGGRRSPLGRAWERLLAEFLMPQLRGFGWWELVTQDVVSNGRTTRYTGIKWRDPASVYQWLVDADETLVGVVQYSAGVYSMAEVPVSQMLYLSRDAEGTNFEGQGLLRSIEPWTRDQTATAQAMMAAVQRWALGTPEAILDREMWNRAHPGKTDADFAAECAAWDGILKSYMSYEKNYITHGNWVALSQFGGMKADSTAGFESVVNLQQRFILTAFLAQFLMLGASGSGGSYSLGQTHADVAQQAAENMLEAVRDDLNTSLIPRMVRWQFGADVPDDALPRLTFKGLRAPLWTQLMDKLPALFAAGAVTPSDDMETEILAETGFKSEPAKRTTDQRVRGIGGRPAATPPAGPVAIRQGGA